ncbi:putative RNA-directed DNA polymerase from transposon X-element [Colletotrichum fructicola]|nr:putative RNA-directed DNA polymerase from transposon X-element [Colletotrichum fructicola]
MTLDAILPYLVHLFKACVNLNHHPECFKESYTVVLKKEGKDNYTLPKSYRPIALLSCVGKALERLVADDLQRLALKYGLIPPTQYGFAGKSCTKALELIVNTVLNGWRATTTDKKWRTTLLGLDISGAFNHVNRQELIKIFAEKGIPLWALRFVWSFLSDQCTSVKLPGHTSAKFWVNVRIPQGSPLSPILFALFAAPILDILQRQNLGRSRILLGLSYVDDTYIMVCTDDWEKNCRILEECHQKIVDWATPRGLRFDPAKYNVMHFRKPHGDLNAASAPQNIPNLPFLTEENLVKETDEGGLRILGVQVDHQLTWKWQIDQIEEKVRKKLNQLKRMSTSVSGPNLLHVRQLYLSTIRPIISYACPAWFMLGNDSSTTYNLRQPYIHRLDNLQNECLVTVAGAYKKAPTVTLHKELHVDPIAVYLQRVAMSHRARNIFTDDYDLINTTSFPFKREMTFLKSHPYKIDYDHARKLVEEAEQQLRESKPSLADATLIDMDPRKRSQVINRYIRAQATLLSEHLWKAYRDRPRPSRTVAYGLRGRPVAAEGKWGAFNLKRYKGLSRAQSSILIQCRTGYIGLKAFLHPKNLADTDMCSCGQDEHTVEHLIFDCPSLASARKNLPIWKWTISRYHAHARQRRSLDDLLTDFSRAVSTWAIHHFGLDHVLKCTFWKLCQHAGYPCSHPLSLFASPFPLSVVGKDHSYCCAYFVHVVLVLQNFLELVDVLFKLFVIGFSRYAATQMRWQCFAPVWSLVVLVISILVNAIEVIDNTLANLDRSFPGYHKQHHDA